MATPKIPDYVMAEAFEGVKQHIRQVEGDLDSLKRKQDSTAAAVEEVRTVPEFDAKQGLASPDNPLVPWIWEAVSDATWDATVTGDEHWAVVVRRVEQDGTLNADSEATKRAIGVEADGAPLLAGDRGFELVSGEGRRNLVPLGASQLNHSFLPSDNGDETFDITAGKVYLDGIDIDASTTAPSATLPATTTNISFAINTHFQIKIDWTSNFLEPDVSWEAGTSFGTNTDLIHYYPILEFGTAGDFSTLIRRRTSDIHAPNYPIPEITDASNPGVLVWNSVDGKLEWVYPTDDYSVLQLKDDGTIDFDYVRVMA